MIKGSASARVIRIVSNQIWLVTFNVPQLTHVFIFTKQSNFAKCFLVPVMLRWHRASVASKIRVLKVDYLILPFFSTKIEISGTK